MAEGQFQGQIATVFGGAGFVGRYIVARLAKLGYTVRVVGRVANAAYFLRTMGSVGQIVPVSCAYRDFSDIEAQVRGSSVVVNTLGILYEGGKSTFDHVHRQIPLWIAQACAREQTPPRFIHLSALGVDIATSKYAKSKRAGEDAVRAEFPSATILRPSVIFGAEDQFFNRFARLSLIAPALPLIGGGKTRFQPVYVGDVADAVIAACANPGAAGQVYELGGPQVMSLRDIYTTLLRHTQRKRMLVSLPWGLARIKASVLGLLPNPLLTTDQVESLKTDNVVTQGRPDFRALGIVPAPVDAILPTYLAQYSPGGKFAEKKRA